MGKTKEIKEHIIAQTGEKLECIICKGNLF